MEKKSNSLCSVTSDFGGVGGPPPTLHRSPPLFPLLPELNPTLKSVQTPLSDYFFHALSQSQSTPLIFSSKKSVFGPLARVKSAYFGSLYLHLHPHLIIYIRLVHPIPPSHIPRIISQPPTMQKSSHIQTT